MFWKANIVNHIFAEISADNVKMTEKCWMQSINIVYEQLLHVFHV